MSRQYTDHSGSSVGGSACTYANLSNYNMAGEVPIPRGTSSGVYIVPNYSAPGYNTLTHDSRPGCSGYFSIDNAYQSNGGACTTKFLKKVCQ